MPLNVGLARNAFIGLRGLQFYRGRIKAWNWIALRIGNHVLYAEWQTSPPRTFRGGKASWD